MAALATDETSNKKVRVKRIVSLLELHPLATRNLSELKLLRLLKDHENVIEVRDASMPSERDRLNDASVVFEVSADLCAQENIVMQFVLT